MTLTMIFLGSGSAFTIGHENYQSNVLFELGDDSLLVDAGSDIRHALYDQKKTYSDIKNVYITHLHGDHCGGLEWLALTTYFDASYQENPLSLSQSSLSTIYGTKHFVVD